jgi:hypothetical protein
MPDYSRITVFILTPLFFRYHLPLTYMRIFLSFPPHSTYLSNSSVYTECRFYHPVYLSIFLSSPFVLTFSPHPLCLSFSPHLESLFLVPFHSRHLYHSHAFTSSLSSLVNFLFLPIYLSASIIHHVFKTQLYFYEYVCTFEKFVLSFIQGC